MYGTVRLDVNGDDPGVSTGGGTHARAAASGVTGSEEGVAAAGWPPALESEDEPPVTEASASEACSDWRCSVTDTSDSSLGEREPSALTAVWKDMEDSASVNEGATAECEGGLADEAAREGRATEGAHEEGREEGRLVWRVVEEAAEEAGASGEMATPIEPSDAVDMPAVAAVESAGEPCTPRAGLGPIAPPLDFGSRSHLRNASSETCHVAPREV